ncbi:MAG: glucose-6-phosphate isomerase [Acetobacteraceae bacterium]|jgi:glucose-6-phosphate isomerase
MIDDAREAAWAALMALAERPDAAAIRPLFAADPDRFGRFSRQAGDVLLDFSKTAISDAVLKALLALAEASDVAGFRARLFAGAAVNATEGRAALHMALRAEPGDDFRAGTEDIMPEMLAVRARMEAFTRAVHEGRILTAKGQRFTDVLNIGIGGSDLGPAMVARALWTDKAPLRGHYLANVDGHAWAEMRARLDPTRTLVLVASKTFTTQETMANAALARDWLRAALDDAGASQHMAALSTNLPATSAFGIAPDRVFGFRDWVGGRYSLWSAIGLSLAVTLGWDAFARLLAGARVMDQHFRNAPLGENLPVLLALLEVWHVNGLGYPSRAVLPYDERLARFPAHLQQLEMESLGKRVALSGGALQRASGPVVFGEPGTNAQHSFMQLLHQGTTPVPVDFILVARPDHAHADSHRKLLANGLAQAEALLNGKDEAAVTAEMRAAGVAEAEIARLLPHRVFPGDRPSVTMLLPQLDAYTLGQLVALYEHKVAVLGALWGINPFDQWGVELGKQLAGAVLAELNAGAPRQGAHDGSTAGLITRIAALWPEGRV